MRFRFSPPRLWLRYLWLHFVLDLHKCSPRIIAQAPRNTNNLPLFLACPSLMANKKVKNCKIATLTHYKERKDPYHEFMVAGVIIDCDGTSCTIHMRMERLVEEEDIQRSSSSSNQSSDQYVISISDRFGHDFVSRCACEVIEIMTFTRLPLYEFCRLLLFTEDSPPSHVLKHQGYWFCWIIKTASQELWGSSTTAGPAKHLDGTFGNTLSKLGRDSDSLNNLLKLYRAFPADDHARVDAKQQDALAKLKAELDMERKRAEERECVFQEERERGQAEWERAKEREREYLKKIECLEAQLRNLSSD